MLPETVAAKAGGSRVEVAVLFEFEFASKTVRFWSGYGRIAAGGHEWVGSGKLITASGLAQPAGLTAPAATFTLSGASPELVSFAAQSQAEVTGRRCAVYLQFLSKAYTPLDSPIPIWVGRMDVLSFRAGGKQRVINLAAETLFVDRTRAPHGFMTDADQKARWSGDRGMESMASLVNKTVKWLRG